jgi:hypothetical protein
MGLLEIRRTACAKIVCVTQEDTTDENAIHAGSGATVLLVPKPSESLLGSAHPKIAALSYIRKSMRYLLSDNLFKRSLPLLTCTKAGAVPYSRAALAIFILLLWSIWRTSVIAFAYSSSL